MANSKSKQQKTLFRIVPAHQPHEGTEMQHIATLRITTRGRFTIPKFVREQLDLGGGETLNFVRQPDGSYTVELADQK